MFGRGSSRKRRRDELRADFHRKLEEIEGNRVCGKEGSRGGGESAWGEEVRGGSESPSFEGGSCGTSELKAAKAQLHALGLATEERHPDMPMLHALQAHPAAPENAEPVENVAQDEGVSSLRS